jgi:hypothetical protein
MGLWRTVAAVLDDEGPVELLTRLDEDGTLGGPKVRFAHPDRLDAEVIEALSRAAERFDVTACGVRPLPEVAASSDGGRCTLALIEAMEAIYDDPDGTAGEPAAIFGAVLFDSMEHLQAVVAGADDHCDPQTAVATIAERGLPDCDLARRLRVDVTALLDAGHTCPEFLFVATPDDRLRVLTIDPLDAAPPEPVAALLDRIRSWVCGGAAEAAEKLGTDPDDTADPEDRAAPSEPPRPTIEDLAEPRPTVEGLAEVVNDQGAAVPLHALMAGRGGPLDGTPWTLFDAHEPDESFLQTLTLASERIDEADARCDLNPASTPSSVDRTGAAVLSVEMRWPVYEPTPRRAGRKRLAAILGMVLLDTAEHLRGVRSGTAELYEPAQLATVQRAAEPPDSGGARPVSDVEPDHRNPAVEIVFAVLPFPVSAADESEPEGAAIVSMSHNPLLDQPAPEPARDLLVTLRRPALAAAAAQLAAIKRRRDT